ncbi:hypothetical protein SASPL_149445 [Salvia splendens]|uniref:Uncharacterized protein n=2 Tax=Salvia splendens TaxID=180675 RepID=A0A8X8WB64_SALSN|nr:hypothetical protein SASPL_149445 [Salvia splendens]
MLCDFEAGIKCLQNPSTISRFFSFPGFWKYGALIFAIFATFSSLIRRIKLIFIRFHTVKPCFIQTEDEFDFSDDEDDVVSVASSDDEQEAEEDRDQRRVDEDFCVRGSILSFRSGQLRQRNRRSSCGGAWSEFASGKNVVKLWDSLGFNLDLDEDLFNYDTSSVVSTWNRNREESSGDFSGELWPAPAVVLTAEGNAKGNGVIFGGYDRRMRSGVPALVAEWKLPATSGGGGLATGGGVSKVYVRDDVSGVVTVGDVRNVRMPLECVRESDGETWWDADAVIVENE